jgi:hypothetical protein
MANDLNNLKARFFAVEKFADQMSNFVRQRYEQEEQDRQYKAA